MAMNKEERVKHWLEMVEDDKSVIANLFENGDYMWCMFIQHLNIERTIKALYIDVHGEEPPKIHDLVYLSFKANLEIDKDQRLFLEIMNGFQIEARYIEYKEKVKKSLNKQKTIEFREKSEEFISWCIQKTNLINY